MPNKNALARTASKFESLKSTNDFGAEHWSARDLQPLLGYGSWTNFKNAVTKAMVSCQRSGNEVAHHFVETDKMVPIGSGGSRRVLDYALTRFACYLIAQNGDPKKEEIAAAQQYFAIQTRRQEIQDQVAHDMERIELRNQTKEENKALNSAAKASGVQSRMFGVFHDAGYRGLYGGLALRHLKERKGIAPKENILDRMDTTELAANQFRLTQTRDKLARDGVKTQQGAIDAHREVGAEVRNAIHNIGGTMPEDLAPAEHIRKAEKRVRDNVSKLAAPRPAELEEGNEGDEAPEAPYSP